jgi:hypothetical protein
MFVRVFILKPGKIRKSEARTGFSSMDICYAEGPKAKEFAGKKLIRTSTQLPLRELYP